MFSPHRFPAISSGWSLWQLTFGLAFLLTIFAPEAPAQTAAQIKIAIVGDSTICDYPAGNERAGWGTVLKSFFPSSYQVVNRAVDGESTKSSLKEGHWQAVLAEKPDIIIAGLGRNDSRAISAKEFEANLREMIRTAKAQNASVILVTPLRKRRYGRDGKLAADSGEDYVAAMKRAAKETGAPLLDLYTASGALLGRLGESGSAMLAAAPDDDLHYGPAGAGQWAVTVARMLKTADPRLGALRAP